MTSGSRLERMMVLGRRISKFKGSEVEECLVYLRNSKEASVGRTKGKGEKDKLR